VTVLLTFERTHLLRAAVESVLGQTRPPDHVIVIDNGTRAAEVLFDEVSDGRLEVLTTGDNLGPAGGYAFGFEHALIAGADKIWVVDDDDIPDQDCLAHLLEKSEGNDVVFPLQFKPDRLQGYPPSWNGPLIDADAIRIGGLPRADLFFWAEDTEFFSRLRDHGVAIRKAPAAMMLHVNPDTHARGEARDWRLYYEVRNTLWLRLRHRKVTRHQAWMALRAVGGKLVNIVLREPHKVASMSLWTRGVGDFALGRLGRRVDPANWPPPADRDAHARTRSVTAIETRYPRSRPAATADRSTVGSSRMRQSAVTET